ncbi:MAG: RIP metalloprotease RseP [Acidobacteriota bacterium]|nr:RIP metalloprotease RseP [Acidobacteriota bacterium]
MWIIQLLLVLGLMVLVHEFGHFAVAKLCRVRVETFAIGFGKKLIGFRRGGTDYQINALPLGGYVKMAGEIPGEAVSHDPGELNNHPRWQRMLIAIAGPIANFILAFVLMTGAYMLHNEVNEYLSGAAVTDYISPDSPVARTGIRSGDTIVRYDVVEHPTWEDVFTRTGLKLNQTVPFSFLHDGQRVDTTLFVAAKDPKDKPEDFSAETLGFVPKMQTTPVQVAALVSGSPADKAGLKAEDQITRIDSLEIHSVATLLTYMQDQKGRPATLTVVRKGQPMTLNVTPQMTEVEGSKAYRLGFQPVLPPVKVEQLSFPKSLKASWRFNTKSAVLIKDVLKGMFQRQISVKSLSGPIGIGQVVHQAASMPGWMPLIETMAGISINLGMFNLLPFPILDGGMIFFLLVESLIRRDFPMHIKERVYQVAFVCLVVFAAVVIFNDITKLPFFAHLKP